MEKPEEEMKMIASTKNQYLVRRAKRSSPTPRPGSTRKRKGNDNRQKKIDAVQFTRPITGYLFFRSRLLLYMYPDKEK